MKFKGISSLLVFLALIIAMFAGINAGSVSTALAPPSGGGGITFTGIIDITPGGEVSYHGNGNTSIVDRSGNFYTLNGSVYGTINIMHNYTVFNGNNFTISNESTTQYFSLNISNASHVSVKFLNINTSDQAGIMVNQSSNDTLSNINDTAALVSLLIGAHTDNITILNSKFALNTSQIVQSFTEDTIVVGALPSPEFSAFVNSSRNIQFTNDTINNTALSSYGIASFVNSPGTVFNNVTFNLFTNTAMLILGNSTTVMNSHFLGYDQYGIQTFPLGNWTLTGISLVGNYFNITTKYFPDSGNPIEAVVPNHTDLNMKHNILNLGNALYGNNLIYGVVSTSSDLNLSYNHIELNNTLNNLAYGMLARYGRISMENNNISMLNTELDTNSAFTGNGANITAYNNTIFYQSDQGSSTTGYGFEINNGNFTASQNTVLSSGASITGISVNGTKNIIVTGNTLRGSLDQLDLNYGIYIKNVKYSTFSNNTVSGFNTSLYSYNSCNDSFYGNYLTGYSMPLNLTSTNNSVFYHNDFTEKSDRSISISKSYNDIFNLSLKIGGNYWNSYTGSDGNNDGIGDSAFVVNGTFVDHYPLMKQWTRPEAVFVAPAGVNGTLWSVTFNGNTLHSTGNKISFNIVNATYQNYSYYYHNTSLYYTQEQSGFFNYMGTGIVVNVPYLHYSYIVGNVNLSGITVYVNGKAVETSHGFFNLTVTAGQYDVEITAPGYVAFNHTYNLTPGVTLNLKPSLQKLPPNSISVFLEYIFAILAVIAVATGLVFYFRRRKKIQ